MEDGLKRLDTLTQEASAQRVQDLILDTDIIARDINDNIVSVRRREASIDDKLAGVIIGVKPSSICYKGCFDHDAPRWKRFKGSRAADSQR